MRTIGILWLATALAVLGMAAERGPIAILSDTDFTAENGVIAGSGAPGDPYILAGWQIRVPQGQRYGIRIEGTTRPFVVRGCTVSGAMDPRGAAILLSEVQGGTVEDCVVRDSLNGIVIQSSQDVAVRDNFLAAGGVGLQVLGTSPDQFRHAIEITNTVNGNPIYYYYGLSGKVLDGIEAGHITLAASRDVTVRGAKVDQGDGITVAFSEGVRIEGADLSRNRAHGIFILASPGTVVTGCERIANSAQAGIAVWMSDRVRVENCGLYANQVGLMVNASDSVLALNNAYAGNAIGVLVDGGARETEIRSSLFYQNRHGIELDAAVGPVVDACAITDSDIAVYAGGHTVYPRVTHSSMVSVGYGLSILASHGTFEGNLITRANIGIIFEETYQTAFPTGNIVRRNLIWRSRDGLYLGRETSGNRIYENLIWRCDRAARDLGANEWAPAGRGNWYSDYTGQDADGDGIGDTPVNFGGGGQDPAPLMDRGFFTGLPGVVGTMAEKIIAVADAAGRRLDVTVRVADEAHERFIGFQGLPPELAQDVGILFTFAKPVPSQFHMSNVFLPLDIVFWGPDGEYLGRNTMEPDSKDRYGTTSPFLMALELPAGRIAAAGLGTGELQLVTSP
ncbi:MAG: right-handed parallel beta-helix repeat-containing protein [Candidatus Acetothermia bacterium]|nr:right-handed parallel beta-helix repeat-containing protein [Candidatus Acetothermia bacterium]